MGYPRKDQTEILKISSAIIKNLCDTENITIYKATQALKMAEDIIADEAKNDVIL